MPIAACWTLLLQVQTDYANIINSVHDKFGVIALILLIAGALVGAISKNWKNQPLVVVAVIAYLLLLVTVVIFRSIPATATVLPGPTPPKPQSQVESVPQPTHVPNRVEKTAERDSAEVNYGCETTINNVTTPIIQLGANPKIIEEQSDWAVATNAKDKSASVTHEQNAEGQITALVGVGSVTGLDRSFWGCNPGGGNGHIHLHAKWTEDEP